MAVLPSSLCWMIGTLSLQVSIALDLVTDLSCMVAPQSGAPGWGFCVIIELYIVWFTGFRINSDIRYGVSASIARFHRAEPGSTPGIGINAVIFHNTFWITYPFVMDNIIPSHLLWDEQWCVLSIFPQSTRGMGALSAANYYGMSVLRY